MRTNEETRRFWEKVVKGETPGACWIWVGAIGADGYGRFWVKDPESETGEKMWRAHRYAAALTFGSAGDHAENMRERAARGRDNLHGLAFLRRSRAERAADSRALRELVLTHGYRQSEVDRLGRGLTIEGQTQLF